MSLNPTKQLNVSAERVDNVLTRLSVENDTLKFDGIPIDISSGTQGQPGRGFWGVTTSLTDSELDEIGVQIGDFIVNGSNGVINVLGQNLAIGRVMERISDTQGQLHGSIRGATGIQGIAGPDGPQGIQGVAGTVGTIRGAFDSLEDLKAEIPVGAPGDFYFVSPDLYVWDDINEEWFTPGQIAGPQGIQGIQGIQGPPGKSVDDGILHLTTGTSNNYNITTSNPITEYEAGMRWLVQIHSSNTSRTAWFNVDGVGAVQIMNRASNAVQVGELQTRGIYWIAYDGTHMQMVGTRPNDVPSLDMMMAGTNNVIRDFTVLRLNEWFNAKSAASSFETGTWTPTDASGLDIYGVVYSSYTKIGNIVFVEMSYDSRSFDRDIKGITGLPYSSMLIQGGSFSLVETRVDDGTFSGRNIYAPLRLDRPDDILTLVPASTMADYELGTALERFPIPLSIGTVTITGWYFVNTELN